MSFGVLGSVESDGARRIEDIDRRELEKWNEKIESWKCHPFGLALID